MLQLLFWLLLFCCSYLPSLFTFGCLRFCTFVSLLDSSLVLQFAFILRSLQFCCSSITFTVLLYLLVVPVLRSAHLLHLFLLRCSFPFCLLFTVLHFTFLLQFVCIYYTYLYYLFYLFYVILFLFTRLICLRLHTHVLFVYFVLRLHVYTFLPPFTVWLFPTFTFTVSFAFATFTFVLFYIYSLPPLRSFSRFWLPPHTRCYVYVFLLFGLFVATFTFTFYHFVCLQFVGLFCSVTFTFCTFFTVCYVCTFTTLFTTFCCICRSQLLLLFYVCLLRLFCLHFCYYTFVVVFVAVCFVHFTV